MATLRALGWSGAAALRLRSAVRSSRAVSRAGAPRQSWEQKGVG
jgi:hypothetical protein